MTRNYYSRSLYRFFTFLIAPIVLFCDVVLRDAKPGAHLCAALGRADDGKALDTAPRSRFKSFVERAMQHRDYFGGSLGYLPA